MNGKRNHISINYSEKIEGNSDQMSEWFTKKAIYFLLLFSLTYFYYNPKEIGKWSLLFYFFFNLKFS